MLHDDSLQVVYPSLQDGGLVILGLRFDRIER